MALIAFAMTWVSIALGIVSESVEAASNITLPFQKLLFLEYGSPPSRFRPGSGGSPSTNRSPPRTRYHPRVAAGPGYRQQLDCRRCLVCGARDCRVLVGDAANERAAVQ